MKPEGPGEFVEPGPGPRRKLVAILVAGVVGGLFILEYLLPRYLAHLKTLPFCEQLAWIEVTLAALFAALMALAPWCLHTGRRMLKLQQYPFPGALVYQRTRIERGARVRRQGYAMVAMAIAFFVLPLGAIVTLHNWASEVEALRCAPDAEKKKARVSPGLRAASAA